MWATDRPSVRRWRLLGNVSKRLLVMHGILFASRSDQKVQNSERAWCTIA